MRGQRGAAKADRPRTTPAPGSEGHGVACNRRWRRGAGGAKAGLWAGARGD
jgi:hypothetical protein